MTVPVELLYNRSHEWARVEGDTVVVGITHYAQDQLGEVVYVELPEVGTGVDTGDELGTLESVKAVSEFLSPAAGEVIEINERLGEDLLDAAGYQEFLEEEND
jgi:glycine cleavage system H protein